MAPSADAQTADQKKATAKAEKIERMLPWGLENRVSAYLTVVKVPLICIVFVLGLIAELKVKQLTEESWTRWGSIAPGGKPSCYAHYLNKTLMKLNHELSLVDKLNQTLLGGALESDIFAHNVTLDPLAPLGPPDFCSVANTCRIEDAHLEKSGTFTGGVDHFLPFAALWFVYKMVFIGVHPVDRLLKMMDGDSGEPQEPVVKLLTEPYFQLCTTACMILVKIFHFIRYKLLPNALLGALLTMEIHPKCPEILVYKMNWFYGTGCYYMIVADLIITGSAFALAKTVLGGKLVGTWSYRLYKTYWMGTCLLANFFAIWALLYTFGGIKAFLQGVRRFTRIVLALDISLHLNLDLFRLLCFCVVALEVLTLQVFIYSILCPPLFRWLPCCKCCRDADDDDEEGGKYEMVKQPQAKAKAKAKAAPTGPGRNVAGSVKDKFLGGIFSKR